MSEQDNKFESCRTGMEIAVVGMGVRFPGARNIDEYWENLENGVECISFFSREELEAQGVSAQLLDHPDYVKAFGALGDIAGFDAAFFGYSPAEATVMDPQLRFLHRCAWEALEDAGYNPESPGSVMGVYFGAGDNPAWKMKVIRAGLSSGSGFADGLLMSKDLYSSRVSYLLNSRGPAVAVNSACSTGLVAIHMACRGLLGGECDLALAGGGTVSAQAKQGYLYTEGMIESRDGHCRPFDKEASGTVFGNGIGLLVLKRLEDALEDRNHIYAVIKGSAVNNDGSRKVGFTAPGVDGQAAVIENGLEMAEVDAGTVDYIETHGTATALGDSIEIKAMTRAFKLKETGVIPIGSAKSNLGHLDCASGVAGFIKAALVLENRVIPPTLHYRAPNPELQLERTPFFVNNKKNPLEINPERPLRAGVNSFGIGGTNAHAVLEEAPPVETGPIDKKPQLLVLSARTAPALEKMTASLAAYFQKHPHAEPGDIAYTLQKGRKAFPVRRVLVCSDPDRAVNHLNNPGEPPVRTFEAAPGQRHMPVVFMFPGQGSQYTQMGAQLYRDLPVFREAMDRCFKLLTPLTGINVRDLVYPPSGRKCAEDLLPTHIAQPVIFAFEYALARLIMHWGIKPQMMIGYSFGEYAAACIAGVFSLEDALELVTLRGKLMGEMPPGAMLSVPLPEEELRPLLTPELSIAIINEPACIVSGPADAVDALEKQMKQRRLMCVRLNASFAPHSSLMDEAVNAFARRLKDVSFNEPSIPLVSCVTGEPLPPGEAAGYQYWARHLQETVRFSKGIRGILREKPPVFIEIGPGRDLSVMVNRYVDELGDIQPKPQVIDLVPPLQKDEPGLEFLLRRVGRLWLYHREIDWDAFHRGNNKNLVRLPTYPFEDKPYWIDSTGPGLPAAPAPGKPKVKREELDSWFYLPSWKLSPLAGGDLDGDFKNSVEAAAPFLVFTGPGEHGEALARRLKQLNAKTVTAAAGSGFNCREDNGGLHYTLDPADGEQYRALIADLDDRGCLPRCVVHTWTVPAGRPGPFTLEQLETAREPGYYSLLHLCRALENRLDDPSKRLRILVVSGGMQDVVGNDLYTPGNALLLGPVRTIPLEHPNISCRSIDIPAADDPGGGAAQDIATQILNEITGSSKDVEVAYRGGRRWVRVFERTCLNPPTETGTRSVQTGTRFKEQGVYLITGGTGGIGFTLARYLGEKLKARLVLSSRTPLEQQSQQVRDNLERLEKQGAEVMAVTADAADEEQMRGLFSRVKERFGVIDGIIHAAGSVDFGGEIRNRDLVTSEESLSARLKGTLLLSSLIEEYDMEPDFIVLCSSLAAAAPVFGQVAYNAGNAFLNAYAHYWEQRRGTRGNSPRLYSIAWAAWQEVGNAVAAARRAGDDPARVLKNAILPAEGVDVFNRITSNPFPMVFVSTTSLPELVKKAALPRLKKAKPTAAKKTVSPGGEHIRPNLDTPFAEPVTPSEKVMADIWKQFFGFDRVGIDDDFFELGGDSLKATTLITRMHQGLNVKIAMEDLFKKTTIRALVPLVEGAEKSAYQSVEPAEEREYYPVSSMQKRLFILNAMGNIGTAYNISDIKAVSGDMDKKKLEKAVNGLVRRHESLRTSFHELNGEPVQKVHPDIDFNVEFHDFTRPGTDGSNTELPPGAEDVIKAFVRPFDLSCAPLLRAGLAAISPDRHVLMLDMHHIISDGSSLPILSRDLQAFFEERQHELPELPIQYKDYTVWQYDGPGRQKLLAAEAYWLDQLGGELPKEEMFTDFPRPPIQSFAGAHMGTPIEKPLNEKVRRLMAETGTTLFMVGLAAFNILLSKFSGREEFLVGTPVAGRGYKEVENLIGIFINSLVMRNFPKREKTFKAFLEEVKEHTLKAFENSDYPFDELLDKVDARKDISRNPLFDTELIVQNMESTEVDVKGLTVEAHDQEIDKTQMDITMEIIEEGDDIFIALQYCTDLFKKETMESFLELFLEILETTADEPDITLGNIKSPYSQGHADQASAVHSDDEDDFGF